MPPITVLDNEFATLLYDPEHKIVHHIIHQPISGDHFHEILNCGTELLREYHAEKWFSDDQHNSVLSTDDRDWGLDVWFEKTKAAGWKYWALVVPPDPAAQMSLTDSIQRFTQAGVRTQIFTEPDEALDWLESL